MKLNLFCIIILFTLSSCGMQLSQSSTNQKIKKEDLALIIGEWVGSLTYLDYKTKQPYKMPANLIIKEGKSKYQLVLKNIYPNEPSANNSDKILMTEDGRFFNKQKIISRDILDSGVIQIKTEFESKDDNNKALIRYTYLLGKESFSNKKEVQFPESKEWILRSEFSYLRKK